MKRCPLCKTKFEDSADFCPNCKAQLEDLDVVKKAAKEPIPKAFWISLLCALAFIGGMYIFYYLVYSNLYT